MDEVQPKISVTAIDAMNGPELAYGILAGEEVDVPPLPLLNNMEAWLARLTEVLVNVFGAPTHNGLETVNEATIGKGTLIVFVTVHVAPVAGSKALKLITCEPGANVNGGGKAPVKIVVE